eukprot:SAG31_NODE_336_length_17493_cov_20.694032_9_plen_37_part_00
MEDFKPPPPPSIDRDKTTAGQHATNYERHDSHHNHE